MTNRVKLTRVRGIADSVSDRAKSAYKKTTAVAAGVGDGIKSVYSKVGAIADAISDRARFAYSSSRMIADILNDRARLAYKKSRAIGGTVSDRARLVYLDSRAVLTYQIAELIKALNLFKEADDSFQVGESQLFEFQKNVSDTFSATDDVDGQTSVVDDQEIQFFKVITDSVRLSESFSSSFTGIRRPSDGYGVGDLAQINTTKFFTDFVGVSEESFFGRSFSNDESTGLSENSVFSIGKGISDNGIWVDSLSVSYGKFIAESSDVSDTPRLSLGKVLDDGGITIDVLVKSTGKGLSNSASIGDSGLITIQNYCDPSYFAQDYVGESRTFT